NHRFNLRMEYKPNDRSSILFRPSISFQQNSGTDSTFGRNLLDGNLLSTTQNVFSSDLQGLKIDNLLFYRYRFEKRGRSLTVSARTGYDQQDGNSQLNSGLVFLTEPGASLDTLNQRSNLGSNGINLDVEARYTEPLGKVGLLLINYSYAPQWNESDRRTYSISPEGDSTLLPAQSSVFTNQYYAHRGGLGLILRKGRELFFISRLNYQRATLAGTQSFPTVFDSTYQFNNLIPFAILRWRVSDQRNFRLIYRGNTDVPTVGQLQEVVDNSNPFQLTTGNPTLSQAYSHRVTVRYGGTNTETSNVFYFLLNSTFTNDFIGTSSLIARRDTVLPGGILLQRGGQLSRPVNLDGYRQISSFLTYGFPAKWIKSNLNFNLSGSYTRRPGMINEALNFSDNYAAGLGVTLSSNVSKNVDFTLSSKSNYNWAFNELQPNLNTEYFSQVSEARVNLIFGPGIVFRTSVLHQYIDGLSDGLDPNYILWNLGVAKKLFKNQRGEIELTAFDVLGQNTNVSRNVASTYVEDIQSQVLQQYFMLTFTYQLRQFEPTQETERPPYPGYGPPRRP
ncbi:MAG: outer membrane beta-barrel protein, partial [Bacteroidota bacterium]